MQREFISEGRHEGVERISISIVGLSDHTIPNIPPFAPSCPLRFPRQLFKTIITESNVWSDGDTLLLTNGERVRLIGVDTPEVHESKKLYRDAERTGRDIETIKELGKKASAFTKSLVDRKEVRLEYDQANSHIGHRDKYGRVLAYVYLRDGTFLNAEIIRQGYGFAYTHFPFAHMEDGDMRGRLGRMGEGCKEDNYGNGTIL